MCYSLITFFFFLSMMSYRWLVWDIYVSFILFFALRYVPNVLVSWYSSNIFSSHHVLFPVSLAFIQLVHIYSCHVENKRYGLVSICWGNHSLRPSAAYSVHCLRIKKMKVVQVAYYESDASDEEVVEENHEINWKKQL